MFKKLIKAIDNLADAIDSLTEMLLNLKAKAVFNDPVVYPHPVQNNLTTPTEPKKTASRRRWTSKEENIVIAGYSKGLAPAAISEILKRQGFDRSAHAIVDHMSELRKLMK